MTEEVRGAWADLPAQVRTWARRGAYAGGLAFALLSGVAVGPSTRGADAALRQRVDTLEVRITTVETVNRYTACVLKYQSDGTDPRACESHLSPDILDFLRPRARP
jgi:hypothetical protein